MFYESLETRSMFTASAVAGIAEVPVTVSEIHLHRPENLRAAEQPAATAERSAASMTTTRRAETFSTRPINNVPFPTAD